MHAGIGTAADANALPLPSEPVGWSPAYCPSGKPRVFAQVADIAKHFRGQPSPGLNKSFSHRGYEYEYGALGD